MVTEPGGEAHALFDARPTESPPGPAGPLSVIVPLDVCPAATVVGDSERPVRTAGVIVRFPLAEFVPLEAVITAVFVAETPVVATVNDADVCPPGTTTDAGGDALPMLEDRLNVSPPAAAGPLIVTVPIEGVPPITEAG